MKKIWYLILLSCILIVPSYANPASKPSSSAYILTVNSAIGPAVAQYIDDGIDSAIDNHAQFIILQLDTPGGLDKSMRQIIKKILNATIPVIAYVAPKGARAASAGTFIVYAAQVAAMAPGTNIGAASPVSLTPTNNNAPKQKKNNVSKKKVSQDAIAYISSLAELRNRNKSFAVAAVKEAKSISANQALKSNVIDLMATDINDLLKQLNHKTITMKHNQTITLKTENITLHNYQANWQIKLLTILTEPSFAYILLILGIYGILFEFFNPGAIVPGVIGALAIILALYGLHLLPINYAGLALIILGIIFFVSEVFVPSFGALGIGGTIAFIFGSLLLLKADMALYGIPWEIIALMSCINLLVLSGLVILALKARKRPKVSGHANLIGHKGIIIAVTKDNTYWVMIAGERWHCWSNDNLMPGQQVIVNSVDGLNLQVKIIKE